MAAPAVEKKAMMNPARAQVRRVTLQEGQTPESVLFPNEASELGDLPVLQARSPVLVTEESEQAEQVQEAKTEIADWMKEFSEEDLTALQSFQGDPAKVAKAFLDTKRAYTKESMEAGGLKKMVADMIEASKQAKTEGAKKTQVETGGDVDLDAFVKSFKDDDFITEPQKAVQKILDVAVKIAEHKAAAKVHPLFEQIAAQQTAHLLQDYPGMVTAENAKKVDALASVMEGVDWQDRYKEGLKVFAAITGYKKPGETPQEIADEGQTQAMRANAQLAPVAAPVPAKKKVWSQRELQNMMIQRPDDYARLQPEILKAYAEGRVK